jgi:hypothetical protein
MWVTAYNLTMYTEVIHVEHFNLVLENHCELKYIE